ncbi:MAG TPA: type II toxin-antitoxin system PemK/MazF family toxin [Candidatus Polarisedimenticolaceae bacterium]|nr:type II toxin-antitoxin system PemK/MazF family toxin [Candidatus Polarisedimenticolaceae bacterium]
MARPKEVAPRRGQVWLVNFDPTVGHEIKKTRPALVIQNDVANKHSPITIVAAITSGFVGKSYPTEVGLPKGEGGLTTDSVALLNQIRSIDKLRLVKRLGTVMATSMEKVEQALALSLGIIKP